MGRLRTRTENSVREYNRRYYLTHKKSRGGKGSMFVCPREATRSTFNSSDLMQMPVEKFAVAVDMITNGERLFTI